ncbi:MAG: transposase [Nodosilinea sp. WJT8-NPBG4]|nr:transposase [Nodosilinea sp. WJT8-NPBG4]
MDNASFHKSQHTQDLIEQAGCTVLFLPSYSLDFNKIEKFWTRLNTIFARRSAPSIPSRIPLMMPLKNCLSCF